MVMLSTVVIDVVNVVTICQKEKFGQIIENNTNTIIIQTVFKAIFITIINPIGLPMPTVETLRIGEISK